MIKYIWKGIHTIDGVKYGISYAIGKKILVDFLYQYDITAIYIFALPVQLSQTTSLSAWQLTLWTEKLHQLIKHNIPINEALHYLSKQNYTSIESSLYYAIYKTMLCGKSFSTAMRSLQLYFGQNFLDIITGSEKTNNTCYTLEQCYKHFQSHYQTIAKIKKTLFYPCLVIIMTAIITVILLCFVLPQFSSLLSSWSSSIPSYTQFLLNISHFILKHTGLLAVSAIVLLFTIVIYYKNIMATCIKITYKIPGLRTIHISYMCYNTLLIWNTALSSGLDLSHTIELTPSHIISQFIPFCLTYLNIDYIFSSIWIIMISFSKAFFLCFYLAIND